MTEDVNILAIQRSKPQMGDGLAAVVRGHLCLARAGVGRPHFGDWLSNSHDEEPVWTGSPGIGRHEVNAL
jgi:hypothetical protein